MSPYVNVRSIQALEDLKTALARFGGEAQESLHAAEQEIRRTLDWLAERHNHWRAEVHHRQEVVVRARNALANCQSSGYYDSRTGKSWYPDCSAQEAALLQAQVYLRQVEDELRKVQDATRLVQQAAADYQRQALRLAAMLNNDLPKATALLGRKVTTLKSYTALGMPVGEVPPANAPADMSSDLEEASSDDIPPAEQPLPATEPQTVEALELLLRLFNVLSEQTPRQLTPTERMTYQRFVDEAVQASPIVANIGDLLKAAIDHPRSLTIEERQVYQRVFDEAGLKLPVEAARLDQLKIARSVSESAPVVAAHTHRAQDHDQPYVGLPETSGVKEQERGPETREGNYGSQEQRG